MKTHKWLFYWTALFAAVCFDILFWEKKPGISIPLFLLVLLGGLFFLARKHTIQPARINFVLAVLAVMLAFSSALREEPFSRLVAIASSLGLLLILVVTFFTGNWVHYRVIDYVSAFLKLLAAVLSRAVFIFASNSKDSSDTENTGRTTSKSVKVFLPILRGLLIAIPVVFVLGALLTSADPIFSQQIKAVFDFDRLGEYIVRIAIILILAYIFTGAYLHAVVPEKKETTPDPNNGWIKPFIGWTESITVLTAVNLLFIAFVIIQFRYFFGGNANIQIDGFTYSEYARRGFGELVAVAVLSLFIYLALGAVVKENNRQQKRIFSGLSILMHSLVLVILVSAFQRMLLYEQAYGFTRLRIYVFIFIAWLAILLISTIIQEAAGRRQRFPLALLVVMIGFSLTFVVMNIDALIVRQNYERTASGHDLDAAYLSELSSDAVPAMIDIVKRQELPLEIKDTFSEELACRYEAANQDEPSPWQSYHFGAARAKRLLVANDSLWPEYTFTIQDGIRMIETPSGSRPCEIYLFPEMQID